MIDKIYRLIIYLFLFFLPLYYLPLLALNLETDKQALLIFTSLLLLLLLTLKAAFTKKISFIRTPVDFILLALCFIFILSTLIYAPNKIESIGKPFGTATIIFVSLLFFLLNQTKTLSITPIIISLILLSILTLVQRFTAIPFFPREITFTSALFPLPILGFLTTDFVLKILKKQPFKSLILPLIGLLVITLATINNLITLISGKTPLMLPPAYAWSILMEGYKNFGNFLIGIGPANYQYIFMLGKPAAFNSAPFWNYIFSSSSTYFLTLASEAGILGAGLFLLLTITIFKSLISQPKNTISKPYVISLIIALVMQFLLPANLLLLTLTFILLAFVVPKHETKKISFSAILPISLIGLISLIVFLQSRYYLSDITFRLAQNSLANNSTDNAQFYLEKSLPLNPFSDRAHLLSGALNFTKASLLDPNATDSAALTQQVEYFQNSILHTQKAIDLNRQNSQYYGQLAQIYESLIGSVSESEKWALDSYNKQIMLDPASPQPKLAAANLLMKLSQDQYASNLIIQAINLKPDWNNAHYNLAVLYSRTQNYSAAQTELQKALQLTPPNTPDYRKLQSEMTTLQSMLQQQSSPSANLSP